MDAAEFRIRGKEMIDYVADYLETIQDRPPLAQVQPGYLKDLIPSEAPDQPEQWKDTFADIERVIMPGVTHWQNPHFHAYFPTTVSYPSILADLLSDPIACVGFSWISSPACIELEMITLDWLAKMCNLPRQFLLGGTGGGVTQAHSSVERAAVLCSVLCHKVAADDQDRMRATALRDVINRDLENGLTPFFVRYQNHNRNATIIISVPYSMK